MYKSVHGDPVHLTGIKKEIEKINSKWDRPDLYLHESWMTDLKDPRNIQNIADHLEPARVFYDDEYCFNEDDLRWLYAYAFSNCLNVRHNANGTIFIQGNLHKIVAKFVDKLEKILPGCSNSPSISGNFLITPSQYGIHNDSTRERDWKSSFTKVPQESPDRKYVPWRNILIPMWIGNEPSTVSHAVFFDQRHIDFAHVYLHGNPYNRDPATTYPIVYDHSTIDFHGIGGKIIPKENSFIQYDKNHWREYLEYTPYQRLTGLTPELTCEWVPGAPFVFDAFQLHATNRGTNIRRRYMKTILDENERPTGGSFVTREREEWSIKMGLLLTFLREIK